MAMNSHRMLANRREYGTGTHTGGEDDFAAR